MAAVKTTHTTEPCLVRLVGTHKKDKEKLETLQPKNMLTEETMRAVAVDRKNPGAEGAQTIILFALCRGL